MENYQSSTTNDTATSANATSANATYIGREIAIGGYREEHRVSDILNAYPELRERISNEYLSGIPFDEVTVNNDRSKIDISSSNNKLRAQVKKTKHGQFQQVDRHWISTVVEAIPGLENIKKMLKEVFEYPLNEERTHVNRDTPLKRLNLEDYTQNELDQFLECLTENKDEIIKNALLGTDVNMMPNILIGSLYRHRLTDMNISQLEVLCNDNNVTMPTKSTKNNLIQLLIESGVPEGAISLDTLLIFKMSDVIDYLNTLDFIIAPRGTSILLGDVLRIQRKGGDNGAPTSNHMQIKLTVTNLIDNVPCIEYSI